MTSHWKAVGQYLTFLFFNFTQFAIFQNLSILDLAPSGVKGLIKDADFCPCSISMNHTTAFNHVPSVSHLQGPLSLQGIGGSCETLGKKLGGHHSHTILSDEEPTLEASLVTVANLP